MLEVVISRLQGKVCLRNDNILTITKHFNSRRIEKNKFCITDTLWVKNQLLKIYNLGERFMDFRKID